MDIRVGWNSKNSEFQKSELDKLFIQVHKANIPNFIPIGLTKFGPSDFKVYVVSYTNKTDDLKAISEISYFQSTKKPKCHICYPYGPINLQGKVWGHAASVCPRYKTSIFGVYSIKTEKLEALLQGPMEAA